MHIVFTIDQLKEPFGEKQERDLSKLIYELHHDIEPKPIPEQQEKALLVNLYEELKYNITQKSTKKENEKTLIGITYETFKKYDLELKYCGFYEPDPENPERTNPRPYNIGKGCSGIPIYEGVIGTAIRLYGKSIYVPDVEALEKQDPKAHFSCDSTMRGAEIVIALSCEYKTGPLKGKPATRITLDLDIPRKNAFSIQGALIIEYIFLPFTRPIFSNQPSYLPLDGIHTPKNLEELAQAS